MAITRFSVVFVATLCGCASPAATPGLANAPRLGTWPSHERPPYDVVADGRDSCERAPTSKPPVWSRSPPCAPNVAPAPHLLAAPSAVPPRAWLPRSRWSLSACLPTEAAIEPLAFTSCCPAGELVCAP